MDNQPAPGDERKISCALCTFSRLSDPNPKTLRRQRGCFRFPPSLVTATTNQGPVIVGGAHVPVTDEGWCFEFFPAFRDENSSMEAPRISQLNRDLSMPFFLPKPDA